jgi:hypothetical protein
LVSGIVVIGVSINENRRPACIQTLGGGHVTEV